MQQTLALVVRKKAGEVDGGAPGSPRLEARPIVSVARDHELRTRDGRQNPRPGRYQCIVSFITFAARHAAENQYYGIPLGRAGRARLAGSKPDDAGFWEPGIRLSGSL